MNRTEPITYAPNSYYVKGYWTDVYWPVAISGELVRTEPVTYAPNTYYVKGYWADIYWPVSGVAPSVKDVYFRGMYRNKFKGMR